MARPKKAAPPPVGDVEIKPSRANSNKAAKMAEPDRKVGGKIKTKRGETRSDGATDVKVPTTKKYGNAKQDREWLEQQVELGLIEDIDPDETDIPFGALKRFTGDLSDLGSHWVLPPEDKRCRGKSKVRDNEGRMIVVEIDGETLPLVRPCAMPNILGASVCVKHGGGTERVKNAAKMRLLAASDKLIGALISIGLNEELDAKARVAAINSALDRAGIKGITEIVVDTPKYRSMMEEMFGDWGGVEDDDE